MDTHIKTITRSVAFAFLSSCPVLAQGGYTWFVNPTTGNSYALTASMPWAQAEAEAVLLGGHLATVRSASENAWLVQTFGAGAVADTRIWIGMTDQAVEGSWLWSSGDPATYTNWGWVEPDNSNGNEHCAALWLIPPNYGGGWAWSDGSGTNPMQAIIEIPVATPSHATTYGTGCGTPPLDFSSTSNPIIGTMAGALIANAPTSFGGVSFGLSNTFSFPITLPYELSGVGMPGCYLLQSNNIFGLPVTPVTASTLQFDAAIPFDPALLTQQFYIQAYAFAPGANASQIVTSNGIAWTIGNQ